MNRFYTVYVIIQARGASLLLITQPDHAALAGRIMRHWKSGHFDAHPRRSSILLAIDEHDNGWREVDAAPVLDPATGGILDFVNAPAVVRRAIWPRSVERLANDPWSAALVANHASHIYRHYRNEIEWQRFFADLEGARDRHLARRPELTLDDLLADYFFLRMGDVLSLTFCNAWNEAPDELGYEIRCDGARLSVSPNPFGGEAVQMNVPARELPTGAFSSPDEAARAFDAAERTFLTGWITADLAATTLLIDR